MTRAASRRKREVRRRRLVWPLLAILTVFGLVYISLFPVRTYLAQRASLNRAHQQLSVLQQQNAALEQQVSGLNTDTEIEKLAREYYNLVRPGEESYNVLPAPPPAINVPPVWPFTTLSQELAR
jgi:cell division protein FtsB